MYAHYVQLEMMHNNLADRYSYCHMSFSGVSRNSYGGGGLFNFSRCGPISENSRENDISAKKVAKYR